MKLGLFKKKIEELERDLFIQRKALLPMGMCPDDIEIFVDYFGQELEPTPIIIEGTIIL